MNKVFIAVAASILVTAFLRRPKRRTSVLAPGSERVVVLGASSGIGRAIAHCYARRGARVCVVGRHLHKLEFVQKECDEISIQAAGGSPSSTHPCVPFAGDFTVPKDMVRLREMLNSEWSGVDTLIVCAGVSSLKPLLEIADVKRGSAMVDATQEGVETVARVGSAAMHGNFVGPLVAAASMIPTLIRTSGSPAILLVSSLAAVIPAPTRSLYAASKSASLLLYQSLAIEHPEIQFTVVLPSTVEGNFRSSAVDGGDVRESDPDTTGLKAFDVAERCVNAIDNKQKSLFIFGFYRWAHLLYWLWPSFVERSAAKKYNYSL